MQVRENEAMESAEQGLRDDLQQLRREVANLKTSLQNKETVIQELEMDLQSQDRALTEVTDRNDRKRCVGGGGCVCACVCVFRGLSVSMTWLRVQRLLQHSVKCYAEQGKPGCSVCAGCVPVHFTAWFVPPGV